MGTFKKARNQRVYYGQKARNERRKGRASNIDHNKMRIGSSKGYFKISALHAMFLHRAFGVNPKTWLGESNVVARIK